MQKNWTVGAKLGISFACLAVVMVALGIASLRTSSQLSAEVERAVNVVARTQVLAGHSATATANMDVHCSSRTRRSPTRSSTNRRNRNWQAASASFPASWRVPRPAGA
jgi:hypothetical protein